MEIKNIMDVAKKAIRIIPGETKAYFPLTGETEVLNGDWISDGYAMRYAYNGGIISFVDEALNWYAIPAINGVEEALKNLGYVKAEFYVPFSTLCAYPLVDKNRWEKLLAEMRAAA